MPWNGRRFCPPEIEHHGIIEVHRYKKGCKLYGWESGAGKITRGDRKPIRSATPASLRELLFQLENSDAVWTHMVVLTLPYDIYCPKPLFLQWLASMPFARTKEHCWAWFQEVQTQTRRLHWHVFLGEDCFPGWYGLQHHTHESVWRNGVRREVLRGFMDDWIVDKWADALRCKTGPFLAFQTGGIVERLDSVEGAGKYVASYAAKLEQKTLPEKEPNAGRWWNISEKAKPKVVSKEILFEMDFDHPVSLVWDGQRVITRDELEGLTNEQANEIQRHLQQLRRTRRYGSEEV